MKQRTASRWALVFVTALIAGSALAMTATGALAQAPDPYASGTPTVLPTRIVNTGSPDDEPTVLPNIITRGPDVDSGVLPFTGGDVAIFLVVASVLIGTGTALTIRAQKKRQKV